MGVCQMFGRACILKDLTAWRSDGISINLIRDYGCKTKYFLQLLGNHKVLRNITRFEHSYLISNKKKWIIIASTGLFTCCDAEKVRVLETLELGARSGANNFALQVLRRRMEALITSFRHYRYLNYCIFYCKLLNLRCILFKIHCHRRHFWCKLKHSCLSL